MAEWLNPGLILDLPMHMVVVGMWMEVDGGGLGIGAAENARKNAARVYGEDADEELCGVCANWNGGVRCNVERGKYGSALWAASLKGHNSIVLMLLEKEADIGRAVHYMWHRHMVMKTSSTCCWRRERTSTCREYSGALKAASLRGHDNIVRLLLQKGAEAGVQGELKTTS